MAPYTLEFLRNAYKNASAAGDQAAADAILRQAQKVAMAQAPQTNEYSPTEGNSFGQNFAEGIGRGAVNVGRHAGNLVGVYPDEKLAEANKLDAPLMNTGGGLVGSMVGEAAVTAPFAVGGSAAIARAGTTGARLAGSAMSRGALEGAGQGFLMANPGERGTGALTGGALGFALPGAMSFGGKVMRGVNKTPEAEALLRQGVDLTPGQMNPRGMFNQFEESWQSTPGVGPAIRSARDNAVNDWQRLVVQEGAPLGTTINKGPGQQMLSEAYAAFDPAYAAGKGFPVGAKIMNNPGADVPLSQAFAQTGKGSRFGLTPEGRQNTVDWATEQLNELVNQARQSGKGLNSDDLMQFRSMLRSQARGLDARDAAGRAQIQMLNDLERKVTQALDSQLPADATAAVRAADMQYGNYKVVEDAMGRAGDQASGMTPQKLEAAIKASTDRGEFARGGGRLRDLEQQGRSTFEQITPPTGARLASIGIPAAAMAANPWLGVPLAAGTLGLSATRTGRRLAGGNTVGQQRAQALVEAMRQRVPELTRGAIDQELQRLLVASSTQR